MHARYIYHRIDENIVLLADEFAVQTCFLGRYGEEIGSDQFGAMIMATRGDNSTSNTQRIVVRLSNIEV
jgi:hypothetical protein